ncbi:hypothetical protein Trydic_g21184 [Trypoxylus dichotomus]
MLISHKHAYHQRVLAQHIDVDWANLGGRGSNNVDEASKPGSTQKTSRTQEDTQMPSTDSRKEDTGLRWTEQGSPANYQLHKASTFDTA